MPRHPTIAVTSVALVMALAAGGCSQDGQDPTDPSGLDATMSSPDRPVEPRTPPAPPFIASSTWGDSDYGVTLKVAPSPAGRTASGPLDAQMAWQEVLQLSPDAKTPGMWEQFECHWSWARILEPTKATWNLEPWRPVVSPDRMLAEGCNPGGPEV